MTFEEAKDYKETLDLEYIRENRVYKTMIVPNNDDDLLNYLLEYRQTNFDDNSAKMFSKNSLYKVCGLSFDGANIFKISL